ncbi:MAG: hypothetical protein B6245_14040 [Desulfobacteraceae bacterium 4572_88]|nr:MAG: hypothetical protein B6245_14040 [Desulfobacteraceae bacterium 4572_88]
MDNEEFFDSFLLRQFHEFYLEIIRQKKNVGHAGQMRHTGLQKKEILTADSSEITPSDKAADSHPVYSALLGVMEEQVAEARRRGGEYGVSFYKEAQYVMAALADEIFLNLDWEGREAWKSNLLEFKLFGTYIAGELFFRKVDDLLKARDPSYTEIAAVYFLAISLGFKGKFKGRQQDEGQIDFYRRQLFTFIFQKSPDLFREAGRLFPESYDHTLREGSGKKLPYLKPWLWLILFLFLLFLVVSHGIWAYSVQELDELIEETLRKLNMIE